MRATFINVSKIMSIQILKIHCASYLLFIFNAPSSSDSSTPLEKSYTTIIPPLAIDIDTMDNGHFLFIHYYPNGQQPRVDRPRCLTVAYEYTVSGSSLLLGSSDSDPLFSIDTEERRTFQPAV